MISMNAGSADGSCGTRPETSERTRVARPGRPSENARADANLGFEDVDSRGQASVPLDENLALADIRDDPAVAGPQTRIASPHGKKLNAIAGLGSAQDPRGEETSTSCVQRLPPVYRRSVNDQPDRSTGPSARMTTRTGTDENYDRRPRRSRAAARVILAAARV